MQKVSKNDNSKQKKLVITIILLSLIAMLLGVGVAAKYVYNTTGENIFAAKRFYFTSNLLSSGGEEYVIGSDIDEISFEVGNNADNLRFSDSDITYTVEVNGEETADSGTLKGGKISYDIVTITNLKAGQTYNVKVKGTAGYKKILKATFVISNEDKNIYTHLQRDPLDNAYVLLTVWTKNVTGEITVEALHEGLVPDETDSVLRTVKNYNKDTNEYENFIFEDETSFTKPYSSRMYRFFLAGEQNTGDITINHFKVLINGDVLATPATP